jgi:hypothetical protein
MKRIFIVLLLTIFAFNYAQSDNRFSDSEQQTTELEKTNSGASVDPQERDGGPGGPGEIVSIDHYLPFLMITAVGLIVFAAHKKKKLLS